MRIPTSKRSTTADSSASHKLKQLDISTMMKHCNYVSLFLVLLTGSALAFAPLLHSPRPSTSLYSTSSGSASTSLVWNTFTDKEIQLEEREDQDSSMTELWLNADGSVRIGQCDGPVLADYKGSWSYNFQDADVQWPFQMTLVRTYNAGDHTGANQAGEFSYSVERKFFGTVEMVGGAFVSATGEIHGLDQAAMVDCCVGYFSLIDEGAEGTGVTP